jgi:uncharacterized protein (TIGR03067 family)
MRALVIMSLLGLVPIRPDPTPKEEVKSPQHMVLGDWRYTGDRANKHPVNGPVYVLRITPTDTEWIENGNVSGSNGFTAKVTFDWTKTPATIDMMPRNGGGILRGIVRLEGDLFTLVWGSGDARPTDFAGTQPLHYFERVRK